MGTDWMGKTFESWGVVWTPAIEHSPFFDCEKCDWPFLDLGSGATVTEEACKQVVGYERSSSGGGKIVFECPVCFEKYWFHASRLIFLEIMGKCSAWPKKEKK